MRKIWALYINEMEKIRRKPSVWVMLAIMLAVILLAGLVMKANVQDSNFFTNDSETEDTDMEWARQDLARLEDIISNGASEYGMAGPYEYARRDVLRVVLEKGIPQSVYYHRYSYYIVEMLNTAENLLQEYYANRENPESPENAENAKAQADRLFSLVRNDDFAGYIAWQKEQLLQGSSENEKEIFTAVLEFRLEKNLTGLDKRDQTRFDKLTQLATYRLSLKNNVDMTYGAAPNPLTPAARAEVEKQVIILDYQMENDILPGDNTDPAQNLVGSGTMLGEVLALLLMIILAGSMISSEISTGSIKSLIIAPVKRWRIFIAKLLALFTMLFVSLLAVYAFTSISQIVFFNSPLPSYIGVSNGKAYELNHYLFYFVYLLARFLPIAVFAAFAFMLSTVTRNTALSVGASLAAYFMGTVINTIVYAIMGATNDWAKFIPFMHFNYYDNLFWGSMFQGQVNGMGAMASLTTPGFSLVYLLILLGIVLYTAFDSFTRRDLK